MNQYIHTHLDTIEPSFDGLKSQKLVLKNVATNVPGKNTSVTMEMTRISAPYWWLISLSC